MIGPPSGGPFSFFGRPVLVPGASNPPTFAPKYPIMSSRTATRASPDLFAPEPFRSAPDAAGPLAAALQSGHLVYLLGAAFIAIAFQPFIYMLIGAQIGLDTYLARKRSATRFQPMQRATGDPMPS